MKTKEIFCLYDYGYMYGDWNKDTKRTLKEFLEIIRRHTDKGDDEIYLSLDINTYNLHNDVSAELTISVKEGN